jgi:ribonuclease D
LNAGAPVMAAWSLLPDATALGRAVERCRASGLLALDTEFMRVRTFHAQAALFQLFDGEQCHLVDPLAIGDLSALSGLLADTSVTKIMHSCSEDLEVCARRLGALPEPLVDTQVLAAFCGHGLSVGYQRLVGLELGIELEKSETRTDWLQRPLSEAQLKYAAEDVIHLPRLHEVLCAHLAADPRKAAWAAAECASIVPRARARDGVTELSAVGGAWRLDRPRLAVLRALHAWRERTARERDLPRSWVVPDAALLKMAEVPVQDERSLAHIGDLPEAARRRHGKALLAEIAAALALDPALMPEPVAAPPGPAETKRIKALKSLVAERAEAFGIAPEMLAKRRDLEDLVRRPPGDKAPDSPLMCGWRREAIGESLLERVRASE